MSITRLTTGLAALVTTLALASNVQAELFKPFDFPPVESDFQFFAPADVDTYGGGPAAKTGWFADYDRVYMNVSRPERLVRPFRIRWVTSPGATVSTSGTWTTIRKAGSSPAGTSTGRTKTWIVVQERLNRFMADA